MKNVLLTGGAGFIGSHVADLLVEQGARVTVVDSLEPQVHSTIPDYLNSDVEYFFDRVRSSRIPYSSFLPSTDTVFYFASKVGPAQSMEEIEDYTECNISNLGYFLQQLLTHGQHVRRIVFSGSMGPYGEGRYRCDSCAKEFLPTSQRSSLEFSCPTCGQAATNLPLNENTPINNISYYGLSKNVQEAMLRLYATSHGLDFVSLRFFSVYGPRQAFGNPYAGPIPIWIQQAARGEDLMVFEDGNQTRDFIYVKDVAGITCRAGAIELPTPIEILNCGTGRATRIREVADFIKERLQAPGNIEITGEIRNGDLRHSLADNTRLRQVLGIDSFTEVREGLAEVVDYGYRTFLQPVKRG